MDADYESKMDEISQGNRPEQALITLNNPNNPPSYIPSDILISNPNNPDNPDNFRGVNWHLS